MNRDRPSASDGLSRRDTLLLATVTLAAPLLPRFVSAAEGAEPDAPPFGHGAEVFNVIDTRQSYLQNIVVAGLRALGFESEASRSVHFSYEIVALSPRCATEMGYTISEEDAGRPYV